MIQVLNLRFFNKLDDQNYFSEIEYSFERGGKPIMRSFQKIIRMPVDMHQLEELAREDRDAVLAPAKAAS